jgi:hypothetical protein
MTEISHRSQYLERFSGNFVKDTKQAEALKQALDIRKFEIELYWKRAKYFWTIIAVAFAGYFVVQKVDTTQSPTMFEPSYIISCLGCVFSLAWYFVNRGSKAWQRNWEMHVDLLEDEIMGPLYKTVINRRTFKFWDITDAYPFSVSKINQVLSLFVSLIWLPLIFKSLLLANLCILSHTVTFISVSLFSVIAIILLIAKGKTAKSDDEIGFDARIRKYKT